MTAVAPASEAYQGKRDLRTRLANRIHSLLERKFPERRLFLKSATDTRFIRLKPVTQCMILLTGSAVMGWAIVATAILLMDSIAAGNLRDQVRRDQITYQQRLNDLSRERDARAEEALAAQARFSSALAQVSVMQSELLGSETRRRELETGIEVIQSNLRTVMKERERARLALAELREMSNGSETVMAAAEGGAVPMSFMAEALARTAKERDRIEADARNAFDTARNLEREIKLMQERNDYIFTQLEEAVTVSVEPLDKMFSKAGLSTDALLKEVRRGYSGQGGPLTPISISTRGDGSADADELRANAILNQMDRLNMYRIATEKAPFAAPLRSAYRLSSPFGGRRDPFTGGHRGHTGTDMAAPTGTPIYATADGMVTRAERVSGYGKLVQVRHAFGLETLYAHASRIHVKKGQKVSRGDHIADIGSTGRSTGPHLHYEVRVNGSPVNPMSFVKAGKDVF